MKGPNRTGPNGYSGGPKWDGPNRNVTLFLWGSGFFLERKGVLKLLLMVNRLTYMTSYNTTRLDAGKIRAQGNK